MMQQQTNELALQMHREAQERRRRMAQAAANRPKVAKPVPVVCANNVVRWLPPEEIERRRREADAQFQRAIEKHAAELAEFDKAMEVVGRATKIRRVLAETAEKHGMTVAEMLGPDRTAGPVRARQEAMWRLKHETLMSLPAIGRAIGGRDHTTVLHGIAAHQARITGVEPARLVANRVRNRLAHYAAKERRKQEARS